MKSKKISPETTKNLEWNASKSHGWKKVVTTASIALAWFFSSCDEVPSSQIIIDPDAKTEQFSFEYHLWWPRDPRIIDYNVTVYKEWDTYKWIIHKKDWWFGEKITINSDNLDGLFDEISKTTENEYITDDTRFRKKSKLNFAKQKYEDELWNNKKSKKVGKYKIRYK